MQDVTDEDPIDSWLENSEDEQWDDVEESDIPEEDIEIDPYEDNEKDLEEDDEEISPPSKTEPILPPLTYPKRPCWIDIKQGDCLVSIAAYYQLKPEFILQQSENKKISEDKNRVHNQLMLGDKIYIPAADNEYLSVSIADKTVFKLKPAATTTISIRFLCGGKARKNLPCRLEINDTYIENNTDERGSVSFDIPALQRNCRLLAEETIEQEKMIEIYQLMLGYLDPINEKSGLKARLAHLGHFIIDEDESDETQLPLAIKRFQKAAEIEVTGTISKDDEKKLKEAHSS